jgi:hypothetical protein
MLTNTSVTVTLPDNHQKFYYLTYNLHIYSESTLLRMLENVETLRKTGFFWILLLEVHQILP